MTHGYESSFGWHRPLFFGVGRVVLRLPAGCLRPVFCSHFQRVFNFCLLPSANCLLPDSYG
jgi:hypothetical protein